MPTKTEVMGRGAIATDKTKTMEIKIKKLKNRNVIRITDKATNVALTLIHKSKNEFLYNYLLPKIQ